VEEWNEEGKGYLGPIAYQHKLLNSTFTLCPKYSSSSLPSSLPGSLLSKHSNAKQNNKTTKQQNNKKLFKGTQP